MENKQELALLSERQLEEDLGFDIVVNDHGGVVYVEMRSVQTQRRISCNGLLPCRGKRRSWDTEIQHGSYSFACLQKHHHLS